MADCDRRDEQFKNIEQLRTFCLKGRRSLVLLERESRFRWSILLNHLNKSFAVGVALMFTYAKGVKKAESVVGISVASD